MLPMPESIVCTFKAVGTGVCMGVDIYMGMGIRKNIGNLSNHKRQSFVSSPQKSS